MIERQIIIGLITSTEYIQQIRSIWDIQLIESPTAKRLAGWVWNYFEKYNKAPNKDIEGIYFVNLKNGKIPKDIAEEIEEDILPSLSDEYTSTDFNLIYLLDETRQYFKERRLLIHIATVDALITNDELDEAEKLVCEYIPLMNTSETDLDLSTDDVLSRIDLAFDSTNQTLIEYPKQLGEFWNSELVRGGFVALMASEKRGKTFWLLDLALRACRQKRKVAFFQAGDMSEGQQLKRICIYLAKRSERAKYCNAHWEPVRDCIHNQMNNCTKEERSCDFGVFDGLDENEIRTDTTITNLITAYEENKAYTPCCDCDDYEKNKWGIPWITPVDEVTPLTKEDARAVVNEYFIRRRRQFKLSSHANGTLSISQIKAILAIWEKQDNFVPDVIIIDYADLLVPETKMEFRHQQNEIWKGLRNLSQTKGQPLVITATQADAASYEQNSLKLKNFSEDKRKYAHVTAMYGLNQDTKDREKRIGIMRLNEIIKREGDFSNGNDVKILQNLRRGRPFLGSYW